ncbi:Cytidine deaminase-like protein [Dioscorea alata]|uniref:Cytidine deaminase-like protein n=1 Tax=Dioscorea alata TaxID=55571 RepID=A0ACB7VLY5_DIOAL|nr:Cytidine deaminase-like protein [Dioscorea alata]
MATAVKRKPVILKEARRGTRCAEVAGGTAAECAAVCCCCPCGLVDLLVLAVVRLPCGLCRRAMRKRRRRRLAALMNGKKKPGVLLAAVKGKGKGGGGDEVEVVVIPRQEEEKEGEKKDDEMVEMEKEMWLKFYSTGFWRSPSQREER